MNEATALPDKKVLRVAATVLLLRDGANGMDIFMVQRNRAIEFASGALVFPGGSIDPDDHAIASDAALVSREGGLSVEDLAIRICGIRETFEESGILLARPSGSGKIVAAAQLAEIEPQRARLVAGDIVFGEILRQHDLVPATDWLVPFAHWITPVNMPKRFDTHFLLAIAPPDHVGRHDGHESVDSLWLAPKTALDGAASGRFTLPFPTVRTLIKLDKLHTAEASMAHARKTPVVTVTPELTTRDDGGMRLRIPPDAGYDGEVFDV